MTISQQELDHLVTERLEWVGRCASAFSHDLGNFVLFAEAAEPQDSADHDSVMPYRELIGHFRQMLRSLDVWKNNDVRNDRVLTVGAWWRAHGGLIRQFVRRRARIEFRNQVGEQFEVPVDAMTRFLSVVTIALDAQVQDLERVSIRATADSEHGALRFDVQTTPAAASTMQWPTLAHDLASETGPIRLTLPNAEFVLAVRVEPSIQRAASNDGESSRCLGT